jgi:uncharacterized membrane protein
MASYATRAKADIRRWTEANLIDERTAGLLMEDVDRNDRRSLSFGNVLAIMAALLFAAAILIFIAASWEVIPRQVRVIMLFATILAGYVGGAMLKLRGSDGFGEAIWLIAAAAFGGSIALIAQMYHLSGDEMVAILTWSLGTGLAAALLRSGPLTVAGVVIAIFWMTSRGFDFWSAVDFPYSYVGVAAAFWALSYWTESKAARHLILLSLVLYVVLLGFDVDEIAVPLALAAGSALVFAASIAAPEAVEQVVRLDGRLPVHALIGFLTGMAMVQAYLINDVPSLALCALVVFGGVATAIVLAGRESRGLRWLAYLGFTLQLCFVYVVMIGTMIGTAGLFLLSGLALGVVAFIITRVEKRMRPAQGPVGDEA